ncbi:MAG: aldehyde dehydrogenase, partial [Paracoccaceae bacterium]
MLDYTQSVPKIKGLYINGNWHQTAQRFDDYNPSDNTVWAKIPNSGVVETQQAINASAAAFKYWS